MVFVGITHYSVGRIKKGGTKKLYLFESRLVIINEQLERRQEEAAEAVPEEEAEAEEAEHAFK